MENEISYVHGKLIDALEALRHAKPEERNETARRLAVTITEMEKVLAYYTTFVVNDPGINKK